MAASTVHSLIIELRHVETDLRAQDLTGAVAHQRALKLLRALHDVLRRPNAWKTLTPADQDDVVAIATQYAPFVKEGFLLRRYLVEELDVQIPEQRHEPGYRSTNAERPERPA